MALFRYIFLLLAIGFVVAIVGAFLLPIILNFIIYSVFIISFIIIGDKYKWGYNVK